MPRGPQPRRGRRRAQRRASARGATAAPHRSWLRSRRLTHATMPLLFVSTVKMCGTCLLYTSDAADDM
eukprot:6227551-Prymnesium_polylepis.1